MLGGRIVVVAAACGWFAAAEEGWFAAAEDRAGTVEPWACSPPQYEERECAAIDNTRSQPDFGLYFANNPKPDCKLAVINAGMPRTGSTLLDQLIEEAVLRLRKTFPIKAVQAGFWRSDRHVFDHGRKNWTLPEMPEGGADVVMTKHHMWDAELSTLCSRNLVISTEREPVPMYVSAVTGFKSPERSCDMIRGSIHQNLHHRYCWQTHAHFPLRFRYEDMKENKVGVTSTVANLVAVLLGLHFDGLDQGASTTVAFSFPPNFYAEEANAAIPGLQSTQGDYDAVLAEKIEKIFPPECRNRDHWKMCFENY